MADFGNRQRSYYTDELNRALPAKVTATQDTLDRALGITDPVMPSGNRQEREALGIFSAFTTTNDVEQRDAGCRAITFPNVGMHEPDARTGCGWWHTADPNTRSIGAYGTRRGPMNPNLDKQYGAGQWIWDPTDARKAEVVKRTAPVKACVDLDLYSTQTPFLGWCASTNRAIMTDGTGRPAYPRQQGGGCPEGETIIMRSGDCPVPPPSSGSGSAGSGSSGSVANICTPSSGKLSPACLQAITHVVCSPNGSLSQALSKGYPSTSSAFNDTYSYVTKGGFSLNPGFVNDGAISVNNALETVVGLRGMAYSTDGSLAAAAAVNLCYGTPFTPCIIAPSARSPFDITCIKQAMLNAGYSGSGELYGKPASFWNEFKTWQELTNKIAWWKQVADRGPAYFGGPNDQVTAIKYVYGVDMRFPQTPDCAPSSFPGLEIWYDGADPNGNGVIPADGAPITTWVNKAKTGKNNASSIRTPATYSTTKRGLVFNGASLYTTNYPSYPGAETIFMVFANPNPGGQNRFLISSNYGGRSFDSGGTGRGRNSVGFSSPGTQWGAATPDGSYMSGTVAMATGVIQNGGSTVYINGGSPFTGPANYIHGTSTYLGGFAEQPFDQVYRGYGMEIIIFNKVLTISQIKSVEGYLAWKWGIEATLPNSHPYKFAAPGKPRPPITPVSATGQINIGDVGMPPGHIYPEPYGLIVSTAVGGSSFNAVRNGIKNGTNYEITVTSNTGEKVTTPLLAINTDGGFYTTMNTPISMKTAFPIPPTRSLAISISPVY